MNDRIGNEGVVVRRYERDESEDGGVFVVGASDERFGERVWGGEEGEGVEELSSTRRDERKRTILVDSHLPSIPMRPVI